MSRLLYKVGAFLRLFLGTFYRLKGVEIGRNIIISLREKIDTHRGKVIIGGNCLITSGIKLLTDDGSSRMIDQADYGDEEVRIGNNVFIGDNAVILRNVKIGDKSVIGTGSIVSHDVPSCSVLVGNPARVIKELKGPFPILNDHKKG